MPVQTRSMARKAAQYSCLQELKKVSSDNIILKNLSILIDRQLKARTRAEAIKRANDLFEHLLIREPAAFIDRQPELKSMTRFKLQELMRSDPTPEFAYTLGRVYQRFFALW